MRTGLAVWGNHAKRYQSLQWMRMKSAQNDLGPNMVLALGWAVGGYLSGAVQPRQQTHGRGQRPGMWVLDPFCKGRLRGQWEMRKR